VAPTNLLASVLAKQNGGNPAYSPLNLRGDPFLGKAGICGGAFAGDGLTTTGAGATVIQGGLPSDIIGNQLPNAPHYTLSVGGQYTWGLGEGWTSTLRGDLYFQGDAFARFYNLPTDVLKSWENVNMTLTFANPTTGWRAQLYVKNLLNTTVISAATPASITFGDTTGIVVNDPRTFGMSLSKRF
jgi:outer membrane receptor protein involved in Fe transport